MAVDLLMHTNFHKAFTASSIIPSIYIQQFWDIIQYDKKAGSYRCQLDKQWFMLTKDTLRESLQITPINNNQAFVAPPSTDGIVTQSNIDYAKRICEELPQYIHTFIEDKRYLSWHTTRKKKATLIVIPSIRFTKLIIHHLQRRHKFHPRPDSPLHLPNEEPVLGYLKFNAKGSKREVFKMPIPGSLITSNIQTASYYQEYLASVAKHRKYLASETGSHLDSPAPMPTRKPKSIAPKAPPRPSVFILVTSAQPAPTSVTAEDAELQKVLEESMKTVYAAVPRGPLPPVVIREPEWRKYQPLPEVPGKGKTKVSKEQLDSEEESKKVVLGATEGAGSSRASRAPGASGSSQVPLPPPPPPSSTNQDNLEMDKDMSLDEQAQLSNDEDIGSAYIPKEACHKLLTDSVDDPILRNNVSKPLPLGGPPGQVTIQSNLFFNKDLEYLRYGSKGNRPALSISKMKAAYYPDAGLKQLVADQFWIDEECKYDIVAMYSISYWWFQRQ
nr:E-beta-farnesene synthase [Tanacetum cinerariifolium]